MSRVLRRCLVPALGLILALPTLALARPNIVVIIGDDMGWPDFGFMGNDRVLTPTLDKLSEDGVTFTHGQLWSSTCRPTHYEFLTGVHDDLWHGGVVSAPTLPRLIGSRRRLETADGSEIWLESRYRTWQAGKLWQHSPEDWGFREHAPEATDITSLRRGDARWGRTGWEVEKCGSLKTEDTDCPATDSWRDFLDSGDWRRDRFFAVLTPEIPHAPANPPQKYVDLYAETEGLVGFQSTHYPMTTWFDEIVWEILEPLRSRNLEQNTLVLFFADNGYNSTTWVDAFYPDLFRGKASFSSLGMRTPFLFRWPKKTKRTAGERYDDLVTLADIFETLTRVARAPKFRRVETDGQDLLRRIRRGRQNRIPRARVVTEVGSPTSSTHARIVTTPRWRYIGDLKNDREELYAIDVDPHEQHDLAPEAADDVLDPLRSVIAQWVEENGL